MLTHSLELALQEADDYQDEQLLERANVSPYFSGAETHTTLSRVSSLCDFSLDSESPPNEHNRVPEATASCDPPPCTTDWDLFLEGKTPHGSPIMYALKTPTAQPFSAFFADDDSPDPTALSPTHMDKKVLVSDQDLKVGTSGEPFIKWDAFGVDATTMKQPRGRRNQSQTRRVHAPQQMPLPFSQGEHYADVSTRPPRRALLSEPQARSRYAPYTADSPRHAGFIITDDVMYLGPRLPALSFPPGCSRTASPCVFPLVDQNWRRSLAVQSTPQCLESERRGLRRPPPVETLSPDEYAAIFRAIPTYPHLAKPKSASRKSHGKRKIGIYTPEARRERLRRFHEKRKRRVFRKRTQYDCRQRLAQACPRVRGRFVRKQAAVPSLNATGGSDTQPLDAV
jgi:hypothetical protein